MRSPSIASSISSLLLALSFSQSALGASTQEWKTRSIYQVMTDRFARTDGSTTHACDTGVGAYCGGTWQGIINKLDYIQGMGFDAVYISPVTAGVTGSTTEGENYHGYWAQDLYQLNSNFGTADDLKNLAKALHDRGMWLMADAVINDMGYIIKKGGKEADVDYSVFNPFNSQDYFHSYEAMDYSNVTCEEWCWLGDDIVALPDLYTEKEEVITIMTSWVQDLISNYSLDGLRVDAAKHVNNAFLKSIVDAAGIYTIGEVYEGGASVFCPYQQFVPGMFNYPNYFAAVQAFTNGNITDLYVQLALTKSICSDTTILASFSENHDVPRVGFYTQDTALLKTMIAWTILSDGIPTIYQGQEHAFSGNGTPYNREALWLSGYDTSSELYQFTALMNKIRKHAITVDPDYVDYISQAIYTDGSTIVLRKGYEGHQVVAVLSNSGKQQTAYDLTIPTAYTTGTVVMDIVSCTNTTINEYSQLIVPMNAGVPHVYFPAYQMNGSQICGMGNWTVNLDALTASSSASSLTMPSFYSSSLAMGLAVFMTFCLL